MNQAQIAALPITAEAGIDIAVTTASAKFQDWLKSMDAAKFVVKSVHLQSVDMFGPTNVGFVKFKADVTDSSGKRVSGIVFMRGGAVGMLVVINGTHAVMTVQPRVATGEFDFVELPAGMLDGSGNFSGIAAKEIEEELHMTIPADKLVEMGTACGADRSGLFYVSPGGSDETIRLFYHAVTMPAAEMQALEGRLTGCLDESEQITLKLLAVEDIWKLPDGKTKVAYLYYKKMQELKLL
jgi:ADP-sugar diphosphatase